MKDTKSLPKEWNVLTFMRNKRGFVHLNYFNNFDSNIHKVIPADDSGHIYYTLMFRKNWSGKIIEHDFVEIRIFNPVEWAQNIAHYGWEGMMGKKTVMDTNKKYFQQIYEDTLNGIATHKGPIDRFIEGCRHYINLCKTKWRGKSNERNTSN